MSSDGVDVSSPVGIPTVSGNTVTYNITARCNQGSSGNLFYTSGNLTDTLPDGLTFVSATPAGFTSTANPDGTTTVAWNYANAAALPRRRRQPLRRTTSTSWTSNRARRSSQPAIRRAPARAFPPCSRSCTVG